MKTYIFWIDFTPVPIEVKAKDKETAEEEIIKVADKWLKDNDVHLEYEINYEGEEEE